MKFGALITWEMLFLKNHRENAMGKLLADPFIKIKIERISGSTVWNAVQFVLIAHPIIGLPKYI